MLMKSMGQFVHKRIGTLNGKEAYRLAMKECISYVEQGLESVDLIRAKIKSIKDDVDHRYPKKLFSKKEEERRHHAMAVDHALEIVNALNARFITGHGDVNIRGYAGGKIVHGNGSHIFEV